VIKYIFTIYCGIVLGILIYEIITSYGNFILSGRFSEIFIQIPFLAYLILSVIGLGMLICAFKDIRGVNASEVFIYGDTRSGKSVFLATLFHFGVRNLWGQVPDEVIIGSDTAERDLSLGVMVDGIRDGHPPKGTEIGEIALYVIKGQMRGILPFTTPLQITMIDYAGGFIDVITKDTCHSAVKLLSDELKQSYDAIDSKMGTKSFLEELKTQYRETFNQNYNVIIPAYLYKRLVLSGKIIFLVNGEYITGEQPGFIQYVMKISQLMKHLGRNKSYAFVITKADEVENGIRGMDDQNPVADMMEREIYDKLIHKYDLFSAIIHTHIVQFFIISVDTTQRAGNEITRLVPWRFLQVVKFISRNV
jgi:hypothetical protein